MDDKKVNEPKSNEKPKTWFDENKTSLLFIAIVIGLVLWKLHVMDVIIAGCGLGFIIFIHELGHFLAAKFCNVYVKKFSLGFGPALPFCKYQLGETTYQLSVIPLGGYVQMVGQEDGVADASEDRDPRSYRNKSIPQRMLIISAGVIMNMILAAVCFVVAYRHGVHEIPAVVSNIEPGGAAWRSGFYPGTKITQIGSIKNPVFPDISPTLMSTRVGQKINLTIEHQNKTQELNIEPIRAEGALYPVLGVAFVASLELEHSKRDKIIPYDHGTPASLATTKDGKEGFKAGDKIIGMTDPNDPAKKVTPFETKPGEWPFFEYHKRLTALAGEQITFLVERYTEPGANDSAPPEQVEIVCAPAYHRNLGMRMRMGQVYATRDGSAAQKAGVIAKTDTTPGDRIIAVEVTGADNKTVRYTTDETELKSNPSAKPLDPLRLPFDLNRWANSKPKDQNVRLTVLRAVDHSEQRVELSVAWDESHQNDMTNPSTTHAPIAINGLGIAYQVLSVVDAVTPGGPAELAGIKPNDEITAVSLPTYVRKDDKVIFDSKKQPIKPHFWAYVNHLYQSSALAVEDNELQSLGVIVKRSGETKELELTIKGTADTSWPMEHRGISLKSAKVLVKAESIPEALGMGWQRTMRTIRATYQTLYSLITGRSSITLISGPITLARVGYILAGQDIWMLIVIIGVISVNLAVMNFLPIPVLDGGHMVMLMYEGVRGKPPSERIQEILIYIGLACVGSLMLLSIGMDLWRLLK